MTENLPTDPTRPSRRRWAFGALIVLAVIGQLVLTSLLIAVALLPMLLFAPTQTSVSLESKEQPVDPDSAPKAAPASAFDESVVWATRYAPDGVGIYYLLEYMSGEDESEQQVAFLKTIGSEPTTVSAENPSVPKDIVYLYENEHAGYAGIDGSDADAAKIGPPSGGTYSADLDPFTGEEGAPLSVRDVATGTRRMLKVWPSGELSAGLWLDGKTLLVALSGRDDDCASLELVSVDSQRTETVFTIPCTPVGDEGAYIDRIVLDPEGFVLFDVDTSWDDGVATLYRYDVQTRRAQRLGSVCDFGSWDYSPARNTIVEPDVAGEYGLVERPLPVP